MTASGGDSVGTRSPVARAFASMERGRSSAGPGRGPDPLVIGASVRRLEPRSSAPADTEPVRPQQDRGAGCRAAARLERGPMRVRPTAACGRPTRLDRVRGAPETAAASSDVDPRSRRNPRMPRVFPGRWIASVLCALAFAAPAFALEECRLLRQPDIQGDRIVFVYAGDLWTV